MWAKTSNVHPLWLVRTYVHPTENLQVLTVALSYGYLLGTFDRCMSGLDACGPLCLVDSNGTKNAPLVRKKMLLDVRVTFEDQHQIFRHLG